jgi:hypothetical protein
MDDTNDGIEAILLELNTIRKELAAIMRELSFVRSEMSRQRVDINYLGTKYPSIGSQFDKE